MSGKNDLYLLCRALLGGGLAEVNHIHGRDNPAEALSKPSFSRSAPTAALSTALTSGILTTPVVSHTTTDDRCGNASALVPPPPPCPPPLPTSGSPAPPPSRPSCCALSCDFLRGFPATRRSRRVLPRARGGRGRACAQRRCAPRHEDPGAAALSAPLEPPRTSSWCWRLTPRGQDGCPILLLAERHWPVHARPWMHAVGPNL